jgi:hypothetical protein
MPGKRLNSIKPEPVVDGRHIFTAQTAVSKLCICDCMMRVTLTK